MWNVHLSTWYVQKKGEGNRKIHKDKINSVFFSKRVICSQTEIITGVVRQWDKPHDSLPYNFAFLCSFNAKADYLEITWQE